AVRSHATAGPVAQRLGTGHGAGHPGRVQDALAAHLTAPHRLLDGVLQSGDEAGRGAGTGGRAAHAGTFSRRSSISSLAFLTALEASAEYPSAPTASAYSWVTGAPPTITITFSRTPAFSSALMFTLNIGIVVVRKAENPTMSGLCSSICSTNFSGGTFTP